MSTENGTNVATQANEDRSLLQTYAKAKGLSGQKMYDTLAATVFPSPRDATPERVHAFLIVARQYDLNPFTREIYAFPAKGKGIIPIVSVDGWYKLMTTHPECAGVRCEVAMSDDGRTPVSATATVYRRGWECPFEVTEYFHEVQRNTEPWRNQPVRMLRHRALVQAARVAFGFGGIYEPDEAARFASSTTPDVREEEPEIVRDMQSRIDAVDSTDDAEDADFREVSDPDRIDPSEIHEENDQ